MSERDRDDLARLYDVADDHETAVLDALRTKAGLTWECRCEPGGWTNPEGASQCGRCGAGQRLAQCPACGVYLAEETAATGEAHPFTRVGKLVTCKYSRIPHRGQPSRTE